MTAEHNQLKEAHDIALDAQAIAVVLSDALLRLAVSGAHDHNELHRHELHRLSHIAGAISRLLIDVVSEIEDVSTLFENLRTRSKMERP
ncbi:UNVERIFIED_ORG: hypothetical protein GGI66_002354 [Rhizobium esperanzae]